ncbi:MAG: glycosyltransferase family 4 protein [Acidimicrobiaceae bacterium]|nr:glycosyltransferase family 4 protein [Acidimicrobiaceae bacterium]
MTDLSKQTLRQTLEGEARVMRKCSLLIFTSQWAASSAIDSYDVDPNRVLIAPFGANLSTQPGQEEVRQLAARRRPDQCNLLFLGQEWGRKGGPHALEVAEELNRSGLKTTLTIVGCSPPVPLPPFAKVVGYIDKGTPGGEEALSRLMEESHFLAFPSIADAFPIAVCEASSRGVPSLARATGGVGEVVADGRNGKLFSVDADAKEWAAFVLQCFDHWPDYLKLSATSFEDYEQRLSWKRNGRLVATAVRQLLGMPEQVIGT